MAQDRKVQKNRRADRQARPRPGTHSSRLIRVALACAVFAIPLSGTGSILARASSRPGITRSSLSSPTRIPITFYFATGDNLYNEVEGRCSS
jgi:hypothetical protein